MRKVTMFNLMTVDGYLAGEGGDISWHHVDDEFHELAIAASNSGNTLLFGRVTYELMARFWTSPEAMRTDPIVAAGMNRSEKIVFSRTLHRADWNNTRLVKDDLVGEVRRLKEGAGRDLTVLGSGSIVTQLAQAGLIDEYDILVNPLVLGRGTPLFKGITERIDLKLIRSWAFRNGNVLLSYAPAGREA